jgi:SAM-dependent methyltransferase
MKDGQEIQEINVEDLMEQIREKMQNQRGPLAVSTTNPSTNSPVTADITSLQSNHDIYHIHLTSHRKLLGPFIVLAKKVVRQLLTPSLERQSGYNAVNNRLALHFWQQTAALQKISSELAEQVRGVRQELTEQIEGRHQHLSKQVREIHEQLTDRTEGRLQQLAEQMRGVQQELSEQIGGVQQELSEQIGGVHQEGGAALQALRGELTERVGEVHQEQVAALQALRAEVGEQVAGVQREQAAALQEMRERSSRAERRVRRLLHSLADGQKTDGQEAGQSSPNPKEVLHRHPEPYFDYFGFEERFRGSEAHIKECQSVYVEYFKGSDQVLDIGCGRGEFLELLKEAGIKAKGLDLDLDMVLYCQDKELDVVRKDAFAYLECLPDESLGGLFTAQVVEHLDPSRVIELVNLCHRKLQSGGVMIVETPNPICLTVFARSFYMDFSHIRPIHPEAMKFLFESVGFQNVQARFSSPVEPSMRIPPLSDVAANVKTAEEFNRGIERLNDLLYGFQEYSVIGRKSSNQ